MATLNLLHWPWNETLVDEHLGVFVAASPRLYGCSPAVARSPHSWLDYADRVRQHLADGSPADVVYVADDWTSEWIRDSILAPLDEHYPAAATYRAELTPLARQALSHADRLYGLPYYTDKIGLIVNTSLLDQVGLDAPPGTWDELLDACRRLRTDLHVEHPLLLSFGAGPKVAYPIGADVLYALALGLTGEDPVAPDLTVGAESGSPLAAAAEWLARARDETAVLEPAGAEAGLLHTVSLMQSGRHAFSLLPVYCLRRAVMPRHQPLHTELRLAPMPGSGRTVGYTRFYGLTQQAVERGPAVVEAATRLIEFLGGRSEVTGRSDYFVAKKWALVEGLGFGVEPLYDDPDIAESFGAWVDFSVYRQYAQHVQARRGPLAPWWRRWRTEAAGALHAFAAGKLDASALAPELAASWRRHAESP